MTKTNWYKWAFIALSLFFIFWLVKSCNSGDTFSCNRTWDTISVKVDTVIKYKTDTIPSYVPVPYKVLEYRDRWYDATEEEGVPSRYPPGTPGTRIIFIDSITGQLYFADTAAILADYNRSYIYSDTVKSDAGAVVIKDTVTRNKIAGRSVEFEIPTQIIDNTITIREPYEPRTQVYAGIGVSGNKESIGVGPEVMLKTKKDQVFTLSAKYLDEIGVIFEFGTLFKISFNKKNH